MRRGDAVQPGHRHLRHRRRRGAGVQLLLQLHVASGRHPRRQWSAVLRQLRPLHECAQRVQPEQHLQRHLQRSHELHSAHRHLRHRPGCRQRQRHRVSCGHTRRGVDDGQLHGVELAAVGGWQPDGGHAHRAAPRWWPVLLRHAAELRQRAERVQQQPAMRCGCRNLLDGSGLWLIQLLRLSFRYAVWRYTNWIWRALLQFVCGLSRRAKQMHAGFSLCVRHCHLFDWTSCRTGCFELVLFRHFAAGLYPEWRWCAVLFFSR